MPPLALGSHDRLPAGGRGGLDGQRPMLLRDVHLSLAPPAIANTQIADYRVRTVETGIALVAAVANRPAAPALPNPLPPAPPPPMSYMNEFAELVDAPALSFQQQNHLLADLRGYLDPIAP